jgi:hypothetical protein
VVLAIVRLNHTPIRTKAESHARAQARSSRCVSMRSKSAEPRLIRSRRGAGDSALRGAGDHAAARDQVRQGTGSGRSRLVVADCLVPDKSDYRKSGFFEIRARRRV